MTRAVDEAPLSAFITQMRDVFVRRLAARAFADKCALEDEMTGLMTLYLGRSARDAAAAAEASGPAVPRATTRDQGCHTPSASSETAAGDERDWKVAAAGREAD